MVANWPATHRGAVRIEVDGLVVLLPGAVGRLDEGGPGLGLARLPEEETRLLHEVLCRPRDTILQFF